VIHPYADGALADKHALKGYHSKINSLGLTASVVTIPVTSTGGGMGHYVGLIRLTDGTSLGFDTLALRSGAPSSYSGRLVRDAVVDASVKWGTFGLDLENGNKCATMSVVNNII
jgi:hypothetical protein